MEERGQAEGKKGSGGRSEVSWLLLAPGLAEKDEEWLPCEKGTSSVGGWTEQNRGREDLFGAPSKYGKRESSELVFTRPDTQSQMET